MHGAPRISRTPPNDGRPPRLNSAYPRGMKIVTLLLTAALLTGCTGGSSEGSDEHESPPPEGESTRPTGSETPAAEAETVSIPCSDNIRQQGKPPPTAEVYAMVDGAVGFPSLKDPALQAVSVTGSDAPGTGEWWWAKQGLVVKGGHRVELRVAPEWADHMRMGWGFAPITRSTSVVAECPSKPDWRSVPGGYWVKKPGCYTVHVQVNSGSVHKVKLGIGAPCPGQQPVPLIEPSR